MEAENSPTSIENWYRRATALDRNWRESRREKERLRGKREGGGGGPKQEKQSLPRPLVWQRRQLLPQQATIGPAPMEGVERTNAVVVRGQGQSAGIPPRQDPFAIEVGTVLLAEDLGIWPATAGTGEEGGHWREGGWNTVGDESRRFLIMRTI